VGEGPPPPPEEGFTSGEKGSFPPRGTSDGGGLVRGVAGADFDGAVVGGGEKGEVVPDVAWTAVGSPPPFLSRRK
jgi:hypothetical protein